MQKQKSDISSNQKTKQLNSTENISNPAESKIKSKKQLKPIQNLGITWLCVDQNSGEISCSQPNFGQLSGELESLFLVHPHGFMVGSCGA